KTGLLSTATAGAPRGQTGYGVACQVWKASTHERRVGDDVRARRLILEAVGGRRLVVARGVAVDAGGAHAAIRGLSSALDEHRHRPRSGGQGEIAGAGQQGTIGALRRP